MNKQEFIELLRDPSKLSSSNIPLLEEVIKNFPYCQPAHILLARAAHQGGSMLAEQKVKKAAAYALDRKKLKKFILDKIQLQGAAIALPELEVVQEVIQPKPEVSVSLHTQEVKNEPTPIMSKPLEPTKKNDSPEIISSSNKEEFYKELEENLKKLHQLKKEISKSESGKEIPKSELEKDISKSTPKPRTTSKFTAPENEEAQPAPLPPLPIFLPKKAPENIEFKYEKPNEAANKPIIPLRQEEDLASEEKQLPADSDLLLNYLSYLDANRQKRDRKKEEEIIEKFIKEDPSIPYLTPGTPTEAREDLSEKSTKISKTPVSENFARILLLQGKRDKALEIYEELMLKYPEKRAYFASKIEELKK